MKTPSILPLAAALAALPFVALAQAQPATAANSQDEIINLDRGVDARTESFKILRSGDKAEINRYVTKVYPLQHANPYEILPYLRTVAALEKGTVSTAWNPGTDGSRRAWIQVNVPEFQIPYIDAAVAAYDVKDFVSAGGDIKFSYRTKYRDATEVADFIRSVLSGDGAIRADSATNTIYFSDSPSDFRRVFAQLQFYDIPAPQLSVEVSIIELTELNDTKLGLDWDAWKRSLSGGGTISGDSVRIEPATGGVLESSQSKFEGLLSVDATAAAQFLNYLVDRGKATVRARTTLTVANNRLSTVTSGTDVPSYTYAFSKDQGRSNLVRAANPATGEGIALAIVPRIAQEAARMDVALTMRSPAGIDKTGAPIFSDQEVSAELTLQEGQTLKLGGLRRSVEAKQRKGIPLLKDIPVLKYLFSSETTLARETELHVFLKPTWTTPVLPNFDAMQADRPLHAERVAELLRANPNLVMSPEDAALLEQYFSSRDGK
jgi:hypothetical protein